ncbi:MAG: tRNA uridine-5-carboxymethylaminomethyl(34) synthesis GTPase MnmE [bacterium]
MESLGLPGLSDRLTIVATATAPGRSALAVVRLSGPDVPTLAEQLLDPTPVQIRRATRCTLRDAAGHAIDEVVATRYQAPHSFTGEDMLEISTHGGLVVPAAVVAVAIELGAREAEPGEFTRRAVLSGKLDLLQAEAIGDLIDARSSAAHRLALRQLDGGLSRRIVELREQILALEALLAYDIDFPEEDDGPVPRQRITATASALITALGELLASGSRGALVHEGALVVLAGAVNAGKSSLFNAMLGEARAIVTEVPGTTRDAIEAVLDLPGYPLRLVDTAGRRETVDIVERLGIEASARYLARATIVLACVDSIEGLAMLPRLRLETTAPVIVVATKCDLVSNRKELWGDVSVSAHTGKGITELLQLIETRVQEEQGPASVDAPVLTRARHHVAVERATIELRHFQRAWDEDLLPSSVSATHVRAAADALAELIGTVHVEDVLDVVFRSFCVGK